MQHLGLLFTLALLGVNLWGLALAAGLVWRNRLFAIAAGPLVAVTAVYAVECHAGLGPSLPGLEVISTLASIGLIALSQGSRTPAFLGPRLGAVVSAWRQDFSPRRMLPALALLGLLSGYAFMWRFAYPDIDGGSEKIADLSYICSYMTGATIPVPDVWYHPYLSTQYYSFQHYAAALMGRVLLLPPGTTYNLAYAVLVGLAGTAFSGAVFLLARKAWVRALVIAGFMVGGTGMTLLVHATDKNVTPWTSMRFIGSAQMDKPPLGPVLRDYNWKYIVKDPEGVPHRMELPGEIFSYVVFLGDYHAPLSGYYLMGTSAMAMILYQRTRRRRYAMMAGGVLTWTLLCNTWVLPLQGLATLAWAGANRDDLRRIIASLAAGAAAVWLAAWVYLSAFTSGASDYNVGLRLVPMNEHTPPLLFLLFLLPTVAIAVLGLASGTASVRRAGGFLLFFLLFSEFFYVKDEYSGMYDRFNTTLKWWPWVSAAGLMVAGPLVLEHSRRRWVRVTALLFCLYPCLYVLDLGQYLMNNPKPNLGKIDGTAYLTKDEFPRLMLARMRVEKPGVVVERPDEQGGFVNSAVLPLFAGQRMWLGWWGHELLWRGNGQDVRRRHELLMKFYAGQVPQGGRWLAAQGVDYVLWYRDGDTPQLWKTVNESLSPEYVWTDILTYSDEDGRRAGFWRRASP